MLLEQLPDSILRNIFRHIETADLINLCCISKDLYSVAVECLYRNIIVMEQNSIADLDFVDLEALKWATTDYTMSYSINKLTETLEIKPALADLVKSLSVNTLRDSEKMPLYQLCRNLKQYHNMSEAFSSDTFQSDTFQSENVSSETVSSETYGLSKFTNTFRVSCHLRCLPTFDNNLTELRLHFSERPDEGKLFEQIADSMIKERVHINLNIISFEHLDVLEYGRPDILILMKEKPAANAPWFSFFKRFADAEKTLSLKTLCLQGLVKNGKQMFTPISKAVRLEDLKTLELAMIENSHDEEDHDERNTPRSFLVLFLESIPKVTKLHIAHCSTCEYCNNNDVISGIQMVQYNQLKKLSIRQGSPSRSSVMTLHGIIMTLQRDLVIISYADENSTGDIFAVALSEKYSLRRICEQLRKSEDYRQHYTPRIVTSDGGSMIMSRRYEDALKIQGKSIVEVLETDIIYVCGKVLLPCLIEYRRNGLCVEMKRNLVIINGRRYNLAPYKSKQQCENTEAFFDESLSLYMD